MIPARIELKVGLVKSDKRWNELAYFKKHPYEIDFGIATDWPFYKTEVRYVEADELSAQVLHVGELDMLRCADNLKILSGEIQAEEAMTVYGLCGWFNAELAAGVMLKTGPDEKKTHWKQMHFPLLKPVKVKVGDAVRVEIRPVEDPRGGPTLWNWSLSNGREQVEMDNSVHHAWIARSLTKGKLV